ncbi:MAG TPA: sialate O-acetylesterase [Tepidisphaeraceae bacterium]|jgi:sialate O-acetylesterase|nr:sialate O-acetylesterase [Tepidisphaeraceae bacterium]
MLIHQFIRRTIATAFTGAAVLAGAPARADVTLPAIFSDHMVLQQGTAVPVWGGADAGEEVTVTFAQQKQTAKADDKGHWIVKLANLPASDKASELIVSGKNKIEFKDVLVGEVWVCSGQSNMEFQVRSTKDHDKEIAGAEHPNIRLFSVPKNVTYEPQSDVKKLHSPQEAIWEECTPATVPSFSAVGYFFGRGLHEELKIPVGLIHSSWGGTVAEAWTESSHLEAEPDLAPMLKRNKDVEAVYRQQLAKWEAEVAENKAAVAFNAAQKAAQPGDPAPQLREVRKLPQRPQDPGQNPNQASVLYNGMIAPIVPFAIKGAIWYQGESNADRAYQYRKLLPTMIKSWRDAWNEPELDFYIVSLANFTAAPKEPGESNWAELREAQAMTAALPHNGQALAIDLADADNPGNIHPKDKQSVGHRLALVALARSYGKAIDYAGPQYKDSKIAGNKMTLRFQFADGLTVKGGEPLKGFQIAGEDKKWHWADAKIEGDSVIVSSPDVEKPAAVRYDWANNPEGNLYNKAGLPTTPFRTDDWVGVTQRGR